MNLHNQEVVPCPNSNFGLLYDNYAPILYGHIYGIIKNKSLAENILQECFVNISTCKEVVTLQGKSFLFWMIQNCNQLLLQHENADKIKKHYCGEGVSVE